MNKHVYLPSPGQRIIFHGNKGTIRYVGKVNGTDGTWLGVEWDDSSRGKHNGVKDGKQYFNCTIPGSGSFIRPTASIVYGRPFKEALYEKYVDFPHDERKKETIILGSSAGAIEVEAVGLDKVRAKLSKLERLRQISLDGTDVAFADPPGVIRRICPNIRELDLSDTLIPSWEVVTLIANELEKLETLSLNRNRLISPQANYDSSTAFASLKELRLNRTLTAWGDMINLLFCMPKLCNLELGYNGLDRLNSLGSDQSPSPITTNLEALNLDGNKLHDWRDIMKALACIPSLRRLVLTANSIRTIPKPEETDVQSTITHLGLQSNLLSEWSSVDALNAWAPRLQSLNCSDNPLIEKTSGFRQMTVAKLPSLITLNGTSITAKERTDCELFYLSHIARSSYATDEERSQMHPQWKSLCAKYGRPEEAGKRETGSDTLGHRLITINVHRIDVNPPEQAAAIRTFVAQLSEPVTLRVLPSMNMRSFRMKLLKSLKIKNTTPASSDGSRPSGVWLVMEDGLLLKLELDRESVDLAWWGIQEGSRLLVFP